MPILLAVLSFPRYRSSVGPLINQRNRHRDELMSRSKQSIRRLSRASGRELFLTPRVAKPLRHVQNTQGGSALAPCRRKAAAPRPKCSEQVPFLALFGQGGSALAPPAGRYRSRRLAISNDESIVIRKYVLRSSSASGTVLAFQFCELAEVAAVKLLR